MDNENPKENGQTASQPHLQELRHPCDMGKPENLAQLQTGSEGEAIDPVLQRQVDENLQLLYRSKLEATLPASLQALVQKLLDEGKPH